MFRRFELRVGALANESEQGQRELVAHYFADHPLPAALVAAVKHCITEYIRGAQPSGVTQAARQLLAQVEFSRPVEGDLRGTHSVFQMLIASKS